MGRRPFSPEELEIISGLALQGFPASKIAVHLATMGFDRSEGSILKCRSYYTSRRDYFDTAPAVMPEPTAISVYPKYTQMVTPSSVAGVMHHTPIQVAVSVRATSLDTPA